MSKKKDRQEDAMEKVREVKISFCALSAAYLVLGLALLIWPDISVPAFCYVFGIALIIFGGAYMILYFTKDKGQSVMQPELVIGVVGAATGAYVLLNMDSMREVIPFALGIVALLGAIVKVQNAFDLKRIKAARWYVMLIWALVLFVFGAVLIANPFDELSDKVIGIFVGLSLLLDGLGNLVSIFWIRIQLRGLKKVSAKEVFQMVSIQDVSDAAAEVQDVICDEDCAEDTVSAKAEKESEEIGVYPVEEIDEE